MRQNILLAKGIVGKVQMFFLNFRYWILDVKFNFSAGRVVGPLV